MDTRIELMYWSCRKLILCMQVAFLAGMLGASVHAQGTNGAQLTSRFVPTTPDTGSAYPFPQNAVYPYGIMPSSRNHLHAESSYVQWKNNYVTTSGACGYRRVLFNDMSSTYSEGIGYGMLLSVNYNDRALFDDLWRYYLAHLDARGLMHWWIGNTCGQILGSTGATDADEDAAFALLLAHKQWGSDGPINYLQSAITQINRIYQHEVEHGTYVLKPGDYWGGSSVTNPSYFAPAYYRAFRAVTGNAGWDSVITRCYEILQRAAHVNTGLVPDWCQANGQPAPGFAYYYYYDATRTPWRIALDYVWFGDQRARNFCRKITDFARAIGSMNIREGYYLDGNPIGQAHINVFVGPFGAGSMGTQASYQAFCDSAYEDNVATVPPYVNGNYYNWSIRTLTLFLQTGNFFNPLDSIPLLPPTPPVLVAPPHGSVGHLATVPLVWNVSPAASHYRLQVALDTSFTQLVVNDSLIADTTYQVQGLAPLTWYYWRVSARNGAGTSAFSQWRSFKTLGVPMQVSLLSPPNNAVGQPTSVVFVWHRSEDQTSMVDRRSAMNAAVHMVSGYWFELATDTTAQPVVRDTSLTDTTNTVTSLANGTLYYWRVRARNDMGWGAFSPWWNFTTVVAPPPAPHLVSPPNGSFGNTTALALVWRRISEAQHYRLQLATDTLFNNLVLDDSTLTDTSRAVSGLQSGVWYVWRVRATNAGGAGSWSEPWSFRTLVQVPTPVALVAPANNALIGADTVLLVWRQSYPEVVRYWLELATDSIFTNPTVDSTMVDTSRTLRQLTIGRRYWWRVRAMNEAGWGPFGEVRAFRIVLTEAAGLAEKPREFELAQNYPNPSNPTSTIRYGLPHAAFVSLIVYDGLGREVATLVASRQEAGYHHVVFDGDGLASGVYYYRMRAGNFVATRKLVLVH
jgi:endo-1,4-beta-D-glucanase Y